VYDDPGVMFEKFTAHQITGVVDVLAFAGRVCDTSKSAVETHSRVAARHTVSFFRDDAPSTFRPNLRQSVQVHQRRRTFPPVPHASHGLH
jgi:hypothetical protein